MRYCEVCDRKTKSMICRNCDGNTSKLTILKRMTGLPRNHFGEECEQ